jgi:nicotinamide-nucleotide amidase
MKAELIIVGSEMLRFGRSDTNADWLIEQLGRIGFVTTGRTLVEDNENRIASAVRAARSHADAVIMTGGLGPTEDDRTREGLAAGLGMPLERDQEVLDALRERLVSRGRPFGENQSKQADRPRGAAWIDNPLGTAPGINIAVEGCALIALPGVPAEMKSMYMETVLPLLSKKGAGGLLRRTLKIAGRSEPSVDQQIRDLYERPGVEVTILSGREGIELHLLAQDPEALEEIDNLMSGRLGSDLYARDGGSLADVCGSLLYERGKTVATAESCTAGMLAAAITEVPGSSSWYRGGVVVYSEDLKTKLAGVKAESIAEHGAVSERVACELAAGVRSRCGADFGIGITGVAGPGGGTTEKPVGLVHIALDDGLDVGHWRILQFGDRHLVRRRTVTAALDRLRRRLLPESGV